MKRAIILSLVGGIAAAGAARADDLMPQGFYLHGFAGAAVPMDAGIKSNDYAADSFFSGDPLDQTPGKLDKIDAMPLLGLGVGYSILPELRAELAFSYRGAHNNVSGHDGHPANLLLDDLGGVTAASGSIRATTYTANLSYDLPVSLGPVKPFITGGVGVALVNASALALTYQGANVSYNGQSTTNLDWRIGAGLSYEVYPNQVLEIAYSYEDSGDIRYPAQSVQSSAIGLPVAMSGLKGSLTTNEIIVGLRTHF